MACASIGPAGCGRSSVAVAPGDCLRAAGDPGLGGVDVKRSSGRPQLALVARDGDPRPAVAAWIETGGTSYGATVLAAVLEARLQSAGFSWVDTRADRDSLGVRALVNDGDQAAAFVLAVRAALAAPVTVEGTEATLASKRVQSLRRHPLDAPIVASVGACTGELGALASDPAPDPLTPAGIAELNGVRARAFGASHVAFGAVGSADVLDRVESAWRDGDSWPAGGSVARAPVTAEVGTYASAQRAPGTARVTVALATARAETAIDLADQLAAGDGLGARLRALTTPYRVTEIHAAARPLGGCLTVTLETARPGPSSPSSISLHHEEHSALAAALALQEIERSRGLLVPRAMAAEGPRLGYHGGRAVRAAEDPREAAELAALWSITSPAKSDDEPAVLAVELPAPSLDPRNADSDLASEMTATSGRFSAALTRAQQGSATPVVEVRTRTERGQGELWLLLASPCGVQDEDDGGAGLSAVAVMTALAERGATGVEGEVTLEPWISPHGVGILAHAGHLPGESTNAMTERVAQATARAFLPSSFSPAAFARARATLLRRVGDGVSLDGRALFALAAAVAPGHPSSIAPWGSWDDLANAGVEGAWLRWAALTSGPLRLAVLSNDDDKQAERAARTIDHWAFRPAHEHAGAAQRVCSPPSPALPKAGLLSATLAPSADGAQALIGIPLVSESPAASAASESGLAELTLAAMNGGSEGYLAKAFAAGTLLGVSAQARLVAAAIPGGAGALVVDVRAPESSLETAVTQVRALLLRLRQGAMTAPDLARSAALRERWDLDASVDPRRRIVDLFRRPRDAADGSTSSSGRASAKAWVPSLEAWRAWTAAALRDEKLIVVLARPKH